MQSGLVHGLLQEIFPVWQTEIGIGVRIDQSKP